MAENSDEELIARHVAGADPSAFAELFHRHGPRILAMYRRSGIPDELCEELVQHCFLSVHRGSRDFRAGSKFRPWLYAIAFNVRREHYRRHFARQEDSFEETDWQEPIVPPAATTASDRLVRRTLDRLPADQRDVIMLHWFEGLDFEEISSIVGASLSAVKVRAHRGYQKLRAALQAT